MSDSDSPRIVDAVGDGSEFKEAEVAFRRLMTPESVCSFRASQVPVSRLPEGLILDPAAGSGGQLAAYGEILEMGCVGVELSPQRSKHCASSLTNLRNGIETLTICGDGVDAAGVMSLVQSRMGSMNISMLHVDPARPLDTQNHSLSEMEPPLRPMLEAWSDYMENGEFGACLLLDLSPRLARQQREEVEDIVKEIFPGLRMTWEWLSRGGGRVDRLTLQTGGLAHQNGEVRCIRLQRDGSFGVLSGEMASNRIKWLGVDPDVGDILALVDPVVIHSGLHRAYEIGAELEGRIKWVHDSDRRPMAILEEGVPVDCPSRAFTAIHGVVEERIEGLLNPMMLDSLAASAMRCGLSKIEIRCACDPKIHPKIVSRLDSILGDMEGDLGFLVDAPRGDSLFLCRKMT